jgi:tRNA nucleotidyltransferase/poly(A) polymerase
VLERAARAAEKLGAPAYLVGGCVRDRLLGIPVKDVDIAVEGSVEPLLEGLKAAGAETFDRFGTARLTFPGGLRVDFARTRKEVYPSPGSLPVVSPADIHSDLYRRDFSINAMAQPLIDKGGGLLDPFGGRTHLKKGELHILHDGSFVDDPTRIYRAARFAARFDLRLAGNTREALDAAVRSGTPKTVSRERLREELLRILDEKEPSKALGLLRDWGALDFIRPGLKWTHADFESPDRWTRLGLLAFKLGRNGPPFLESLRLEHGLRRDLEHPIELAERREAPKEPLSKLSLGVIRRALPGLPAAALKPPLAGGAELMKLGLEPGPKFGKLLHELSKAQWSGKVKTPSQARAFLKNIL